MIHAAVYVKDILKANDLLKNAFIKAKVLSLGVNTNNTLSYIINSILIIKLNTLIIIIIIM